MSKVDKYFVSFDITERLIELGLNPRDDDYSCIHFISPDNIGCRALYSRVLQFLDSLGYVILLDAAYHSDNNYTFRSELYHKGEKLYTSEWTTTREFALDDSITKTLKDYL